MQASIPTHDIAMCGARFRNDTHDPELLVAGRRSATIRGPTVFDKDEHDFIISNAKKDSQIRIEECI